ncbi:hypothetical protein [Methyloradius palustris]|uniref:Uncharacterized protein n=1 Tax=Methyloradius palustris TaxID=2778876 RepID=A0A8D5GBS4_9PROT|nr:hypothetical protein [Methyloradius palustris]BCM25366.1 hypothetical protein ZMTM_16250 [Methyloradius palustris]
MTTLQNNIIEYLIDYQHITAFNAYECKKQGLTVRSEGLKHKADIIGNAVRDYQAECTAAH